MALSYFKFEVFLSRISRLSLGGVNEKALDALPRSVQFPNSDKTVLDLSRRGAALGAFGNNYVPRRWQTLAFVLALAAFGLLALAISGCDGLQTTSISNLFTRRS